MKNIHSILLLILTLLVNSGFACSNISIKTDLQNESEWLKPGLLNSKRIELKFGSYGVQAIPQENNQVRLSNLFSISQGRKYTRTIALTLFTDVLDPSLEISHQEILNGGSIGIVLNKNGFLIKKDIFYIDELNDASLFSKFMDVDSNSIAIIIYDLSIEKDNRILPYCTIIEVYSPEFLNITEIKNLYKTSTGTTVVENINMKNDIRIKKMIKAIRECLASFMDKSNANIN